MMTANNIFKYGFALIFWGILLIIFFGWLWTKVAVRSSSVQVNESKSYKLYDQLYQFMEPIEEAICFHHVLDNKEGETFIFHSYSFFAIKCGATELVLDSYARKIEVDFPDFSRH